MAEPALEMSEPAREQLTTAEPAYLTALGLTASSPARCPGSQPGGRRCRSKPGPSGFCHLHDPQNAEQLALRRKLGGVARRRLPRGSAEPADGIAEQHAHRGDQHQLAAGRGLRSRRA